MRWMAKLLLISGVILAIARKPVTGLVFIIAASVARRIQ